MAAPDPERLDPELWALVERRLPIACVDALPVRIASDGTLAAFGLIRRHLVTGGTGWCLIGGRVLYGETLQKALAREVSQALGEAVTALPLSAGEPDHVAEYSPAGPPDFLRDPRKHAIAMTYMVRLDGEVHPGGEAMDFAWFAPGQLSRYDVGFDQDQVISACLAHLVGGRTADLWSLSSDVTTP